MGDFEGGMASFHKVWNIWPPGERNTVGTVSVEPGKGRHGSAALHVALKAPPGGTWPDFHIYHQADLALRLGHRYRVSLWARAKPARNLQIAFYRPGATFRFLGGPPGPFQSQIKLAAEAGVDLVSFPMELPWPKPGEPVDWSSVDAQCRTVLEANPRALLLPRIGMDPPAWWYELHPDDRMVWKGGLPENVGAVVASPAYRRDAAERLAALVAHLEEKFGDHVAGYHPCGQNTGEWFYQDTWLPPLNGYAKGDLPAWRAWLKARYHDDASLRAAWHDPKAALDTAAVPSPAARRAAPAGVLRDPVAERSLIDFALFQQEAMADCVCQLAHAAAASVARPQAGRVLLRLCLRVRPRWQRAGHFRALRLAPRAELPRHRRPLLADLLFRPRAGRERPGHDRRGERRPGRQNVALRRRHADLPGQRSRLSIVSTRSSKRTMSCCATRPNARCGTSAPGGWTWAPPAGSTTGGCGPR